MTPTNHLDELKKLRDETYSPFKRTPAQIAALDHVIKREESLADAEGHAALLNDANLYQCLYPAKRKRFEAALEAGALAVTERPALMAEVDRLMELLRDLWNVPAGGCDHDVGICHCELFNRVEAVLKEAGHE